MEPFPPWFQSSPKTYNQTPVAMVGMGRQQWGRAVQFTHMVPVAFTVGTTSPGVLVHPNRQGYADTTGFQDGSQR
jgi:hypothetical protein